MKTPILLGIASAILCLAGCSSNSSNGTSSSNVPNSAQGGKHLKLAFVTNNSSDYWTIARRGVEQAQQELGPNVQVDFRMPVSGQDAEQQSIVEDLLTTGVDGMAISPIDPANQTDMINKAASQTLVFTQDSDAPNSNRACYVGTDNVAAGKQLGGEILKALPKGGQIIAFVGKLDAQNAKDRIEGIKEAIQGSNVTLADIRTDDTDHAKAKENVADVLVKNPNIAGLIGIWSYNGPAILSAVKDANMVGKVQILCFDEEDDTLAGVKSGAIYATVVQNPYKFGHDAIIMMNKYLNGDKSVIPANKLDYIPTRVLHKEDIDAFKANLDKLRGKS